MRRGETKFAELGLDKQFAISEESTAVAETSLVDTFFATARPLLEALGPVSILEFIDYVIIKNVVRAGTPDVITIDPYNFTQSEIYEFKDRIAEGYRPLKPQSDNIGF